MVGLNIGVSPYGGGKGGAIGFMRHLAVENARSGRHRQHPRHRAHGHARPEGHRRPGPQIPVGRTGPPEDIGYACVYLASEEAAWVTGQTIQVNGGSVTT